MKKEYITPEIEILELLSEMYLLETSGSQTDEVSGPQPTDPTDSGVNEFD